MLKVISQNQPCGALSGILDETFVNMEREKDPYNEYSKNKEENVFVNM